MRTRTILLGASLLGAGALFVYFGLHHIFIFKPNPTPSVSVNTSASGEFESRVDDQGAVTIEVTPLKIDPSGQSQFEISLNTHSVQLDADLTKQAYLYDDQSHFFKPLSWTGSEPGGHHRSGTLTFGPLDSAPKYIDIKITDIGGIPVRIFSWKLK